MKFSKVISFLKKNKYLFGILVLGLVLRLYNYKELYAFGHDQDLQGWFIKDVLVNKHLRLIGQETSTLGIFIGPLFYYLLIPFYLFSSMDPIGGVFLTLIIGLFTIWSFYYVLGKIFDEKTGLTAAFIYALSFYTVFNDREVVPTMSVILWTIWFLYGLYLTYKGLAFKGLVLLGVLAGLIWHLNMGLIIILPLVLLVILVSERKPSINSLIYSGLVFFATSLPLILFEIRHGFSQTKYFISSLVSDQHDIVSGEEKIERVFHLMSKNFSSVVWGDYFELPYEYVFWFFVVIFVTLILKNKLNKNLALILGAWTFIYIAFFSLYSKIVSEYYLNGTIVVFITVLSLGISNLMKYKKYEDFAKAFLLLFTIVSLDRFVTLPINKSGYLERNQILDAIKSDQIARGYDCVSISYITNPGYDRGYRYLTWIKDIKTKPISESVPVYTIVFPLKKIFETDETRGAIGLIYPDYEKYEVNEIRKSCVGENFNLTDSMIGFTE